MSRTVRLRRAAQWEFDHSADWYEARQKGLGVRFTAAVNRVLDAIAIEPERWPEVEPGIREAAVRRWPFCIYFESHPDHVLVLAIFHTSRDPTEWRNRIA